MTPPGRALVLFDGVCNLCNGTVRFILARDPAGYFQFAALQSKAALRLAAGPRNGQSVVLVERSQIYTKSNAALRIARHLRFPWPLLYGFIVVPRFLRDAVYDWVARNRYRWFGRRETCMLPTPEMKKRFLE